MIQTTRTRQDSINARCFSVPVHFFHFFTATEQIFQSFVASMFYSTQKNRMSHDNFETHTHYVTYGWSILFTTLCVSEFDSRQLQGPSPLLRQETASGISFFVLPNRCLLAASSQIFICSFSDVLLLVKRI